MNLLTLSLMLVAYLLLRHKVALQLRSVSHLPNNVRAGAVSCAPLPHSFAIFVRQFPVLCPHLCVDRFYFVYRRANSVVYRSRVAGFRRLCLVSSFAMLPFQACGYFMFCILFFIWCILFWCNVIRVFFYPLKRICCLHSSTAIGMSPFYTGDLLSAGSRIMIQADCS